MNIQIFGTTKCFDTKKTQRYFKERNKDTYRKKWKAGYCGILPGCVERMDIID